MLEITTKQQKKPVQIDGYTYYVREYGAGEALRLQQSGRELEELSKLDDLTSEQKERIETLSMDLLELSLSLFETEEATAKKHLEQLGVETLMKVITQIQEAVIAS